MQRDDALSAVGRRGPSVSTPTWPSRFRVKDGKSQVRAGDGEWQTNDSAHIAFAPEGDLLLAFLDFATDIAYIGDETVGEQKVAKYSFAVDPVRSMLTVCARFRRSGLWPKGTLPAGVAMQAPEHVAQMTGQGEAAD